MAVFELTVAQLAIFSSAVALAGGFGFWGAFHYHGSNPPWGSVFNDKEYLDSLPNHSYGKRYSQFLVHPTGDTNYQNSWVNNRYWWDKQWYKYEKELETETHPWFKKVEISYLSISCHDVYQILDITNVEWNEPDANEKVLWKYCSPIGYKPYTLAKAEEYSQYCPKGTASQCITSDSNEHHKLASTGSKKIKELEAAGKDPANIEELPPESNALFWAIKDRWYRFVVDYRSDLVDENFKSFTTKLNKKIYKEKGRKPLLREVCEHAYNHKKESGSNNLNNITIDVLTKYCGVSDTWRSKTTINR